MPKQLILCDCMGSQNIDPEALSSACGLSCSRLHTALCTDQIELAAKAIKSSDAIIACQQERQRFEELAADIGAADPGFVDLRDRAGWSDDDRPKLAKMAALIAESQLAEAETKSIDVVSDGICLIVGSAESALPAARHLYEHLGVTVLLPPGSEQSLELASERRFDIVLGTLKHAAGSLGGFTVEIDAFSQIIPGGRGRFQLTGPQDGAQSECDVIVDLSGAAPLFSVPGKRDGYLRADPKSQQQVAKAIFEASHLVGTFEKPLYVRLEAALCAHSRAGKAGCSKCLDNCPTGAISPDGDHVAIDPAVCAGCGTCSSICPSGAISYDAPPVSAIFKRIETLASKYRAVARQAPRLLVHDGTFGSELISLSARYHSGLPADVIPMEVSTLASFGHAEILAALGSGFAAVAILLSSDTERHPIEQEVALATAISSPGAVFVLDITDPERLTAALHSEQEEQPISKPIMPVGNRRQVTRLAAKALHAGSETLALPENAPYGSVKVDIEACTLCLACVSLCPSGAFGDNPDAPQLRFQESACLQCGLCSNVCPETAITLRPQLNLADEALSHRVLHEEEPFSCIECGKPFGVKSTVMRITEKLAGKHSMYQNSDTVRLIQMCDDCRVNLQFQSKQNPFTGDERPRVRTTDDYLSKRRDH